MGRIHDNHSPERIQDEASHKRDDRPRQKYGWQGEQDATTLQDNKSKVSEREKQSTDPSIYLQLAR